MEIKKLFMMDLSEIRDYIKGIMEKNGESPSLERLNLSSEDENLEIYTNNRIGWIDNVRYEFFEISFRQNNVMKDDRFHYNISSPVITIIYDRQKGHYIYKGVKKSGVFHFKFEKRTVGKGSEWRHDYSDLLGIKGAVSTYKELQDLYQKYQDRCGKFTKREITDCGNDALNILPNIMMFVDGLTANEAKKIAIRLSVRRDSFGWEREYDEIKEDERFLNRQRKLIDIILKSIREKKKNRKSYRNVQSKINSEIQDRVNQLREEMAEKYKMPIELVSKIELKSLGKMDDAFKVYPKVINEFN